MKRAERRRNEKALGVAKHSEVQKYIEHEVDRVKFNITADTMELVTAVACLVLKDEQKFGKRRLTHFVGSMMKHFELINDGKENHNDIVMDLRTLCPPGTFDEVE